MPIPSYSGFVQFTESAANSEVDRNWQKLSIKLS
jgi:hypothetical protein